MNLHLIEQQAAQATSELVEQAGLVAGSIFVVGCSSSEVIGEQIGQCSSIEAAQAVFNGILSVLQPKGIYLAAQCCEHLNRAIVLPMAAVKTLATASLCHAATQSRGQLCHCCMATIRTSCGIGAGTGRCWIRYWRHTDWNASKSCGGSCSVANKADRASHADCSSHQTKVYWWAPCRIPLIFQCKGGLLHDNRATAKATCLHS